MSQNTPAADAYRAAQTDPAQLIDQLQIAKAMLGQSVIELAESRAEIEQQAATLAALFAWAREFAQHEFVLAELSKPPYKAMLADLAAGRVPTWAPWDELGTNSPIDITDAVETPRSKRTPEQQAVCEAVAQQLERRIVEMVPFSGPEHQDEALRLQASGRRFSMQTDHTNIWCHPEDWMFTEDSPVRYRMLPLCRATAEPQTSQHHA